MSLRDPRRFRRDEAISKIIGRIAASFEDSFLAMTVNYETQYTHIGRYDKEILHELKGPSINTLSPRTDITEKIFERVKITLEDGFYVKRIIEHYFMFREHIENLASDVTNHLSIPKIPGRNELCPCGSGKKFKHCCLSKNE